MAKDKKQKNNSESYTAKDIYILEGLEPVRKRPGMYIGSTGPDGLHHLVWEVVDNGIDEAMAGYAKNIAVTLLPQNRVMVVDDGRGIPVETHKQTKKSALETVMTTLHAGAKFGGESYKVAGGLHGVGVSVVNALSKWMKVEVCRDGWQYVQEYERGKAKYTVKKNGKCEGSGTAVTFEPDSEIFSALGGSASGGKETIGFDWERIIEHLRQQAYLTRGVKIVVIDQRETITPKDKTAEAAPKNIYTMYFEGGVISYVKFLNSKETPKHENIFYVHRQTDVGENRKILVETAFQYTEDISAKEISFANNIHTPEGGTHLTGFRTALTRTLNDYAKKNEYVKKEEENLTGEDVREGLTAVVSVKLREPQFEGQTKAKLGNPEARTAVESVIGEAVQEFLEKHPQDAELIIGKALLAQKARMAAKAAKETVLRKGALEGFTLPGKLADCQSRNAAESEIFIVEGDSAGGCFVGDTKIALTDGRSLTLKELVEENRTGKKNYCYTVCGDGSIAIGEIKNPRLTRRETTVLKITLNNDEEIICTPDHKLMLRDGSYKEAKNLLRHDSLMPLYRKYSKIGGRITIDGYEMVLNPSNHQWVFTHLLADRHNLANGIYYEANGSYRHHKDFNKLNNNPSNLVCLTKEEHLEIHRQLARLTLHRPDVKEKAAQSRRTPEYRERARAKTLERREFFSANAKKQWEDPAYKAYMLRSFLNFYRSNEKYREKNNALLNAVQQVYWGKEENRKEQAERVRTFFKNRPERRRWLSEIAKRQWLDQNLQRWRRKKTKEQWTPEFRLERKKAYNKTYLKRALAALRRIYDECGFLDEEAYNRIRRETHDKNLIRLETIRSRFFSGNSESLVEAVKNYNHKIKSLTLLDARADVYDFEVPGTHNFALASGVFVHNSAKQGRDRSFQAILPLRGKILNVERARLDKMLASQEIRALVIAMGAAIGDAFDIGRMRYHRIVIMTDADVDGAHIRTLLLTLFFRYFRPVIEAGYLYIAQPPLYRLQKGKEAKYAYSDADKEKIIAELQKAKAEGQKTKAKGHDEETTETSVAETTTDAGEESTEKVKAVNIQRYKGLGEMNPEQLWDTTMNPGTRIMKQVSIEDAENADRIFDVLMGDEVLPRKKFIQAHAKAVKNLDI